MAIGTGIPGVLLWTAFLGSLAWFGLRRFLDTRNYAALALFFVILDFSTRLLLDSVTKDHMLQQFVLVTGLLAVQTAGASRSKQQTG
jgi:O-antigen ligase